MIMNQTRMRTILLNLDGDGPTAVIVTHRAAGNTAGCGGKIEHVQ